MHIKTPPLSVLITLSILSLSLLAKESSGITDPKFLNCSAPKTCGGIDIHFPFYVENQQPAFCGFPGFMVSCISNLTFIKLSGTDYFIENITYWNHSLRVSNAAIRNYNSSSTSCVPELQNLTYLPPNQLNFSTKVTHLSLFYDCNSSSLSQDVVPYKINCSSQQQEDGSSNGSFLAIHNKEVVDPKIVSNASSGCGSVVDAPVELEGDYHNNGSNGIIMNILRNGFELSWAAANCSVCGGSGGRCGFDYEIYQFKCYCPDRPHALRCIKGDRKRILKIGLGVGSGCIVIFALCIFSIYWSWYRPKRHSAKILSKSSSLDPSLSRDSQGGNIYFGVPVFSKSELEEATNYFDVSRELGDGGFGTVYYGKLQDGREVAVKRLYEHNYRRVKQFMTEVEILTRLHHKHLVHLYGCTSRHSRELLLVYEYIPNGTVADHIHGDRAMQGLLPWAVRMSIAIETASALQYLHSSGIIHRDVKTHNILLDGNFCVKVADFGLSRLFPNDVTHVSTAPQGTPGYVDPEYHQCYQLTEKSDVYSFGVVLMELISSKPAVDITRDKHEINLSNFAISKIQKQAFSELIDPALGSDLDPEINRMTTSVAELAFRCLQQDKEMRPTMEDVLEELKAIARTDDAKSRNPPPSPECEDAGLLENIKFGFSPVSVTQRWHSNGSSSTYNRSN